MLFFLYPIEGPRWHFADLYLNDIDGFLFRPMVEYVIANGAVRGGCMPSSHVGVALVIMTYCFRNYRKWGWILVPINIGLALGAVWGRFHYASDIVIGALLALASVWIADRICAHRKQAAPADSMTQIKRTKIVS
jgi:membrane-associated phospholipid phosphatase